MVFLEQSTEAAKKPQELSFNCFLPVHRSISIRVEDSGSHFRYNFGPPSSQAWLSGGVLPDTAVYCDTHAAHGQSHVAVQVHAVISAAPASRQRRASWQLVSPPVLFGRKDAVSPALTQLGISPECSHSAAFLGGPTGLHLGLEPVTFGFQVHLSKPLPREHVKTMKDSKCK